MDKLWVTCPTEQSAIEGNKLEIHATSWKKKNLKKHYAKKNRFERLYTAWLHLCLWLSGKKKLLNQWLSCKGTTRELLGWWLHTVPFFFFLPYCTLSEVLLYTVYICQNCMLMRFYSMWTLISLTLKKEKYITIHWYTKLCYLNFKII